MVKRGFIFSVFFTFLMYLGLILNGCATTYKQGDLKAQGLKNQIQVLEIELQNKDREIESLRDALNKTEEEKSSIAEEMRKKKAIKEVKSRPSVKQIQIALQNASYDPGRIDGRMGRQTRIAIRAFQRANNLSADGKVGKRTWSLLKEYLYRKIK